jgi:hypothetical protein
LCQHRSAEDGESGNVNEKRARPKVVVGILLLILTPVGLFVKPASGGAVIRDLVLVAWWAFVIWLLVTGFKEPKPTDSK